MQPKINDGFEIFIHFLKEDLADRYTVCEDFSATPSSILLGVLNSVAEAERKYVEYKNEKALTNADDTVK